MAGRGFLGDHGTTTTNPSLPPMSHDLLIVFGVLLFSIATAVIAVLADE